MKRKTPKKSSKQPRVINTINVYFLGPYARRVSFAAQQNRSLNLVWALHSLGHIKVSSDQKCAVVGGGVAGVTASAALASLGYNVFLFETGETVLNRQNGTLHRYIHPNINSWPNEKPKPTTQFPYFDWMCDTCNRIMSLLRSEWDEVAQSSQISAAIGCTVTNFHEAGDSVAIEADDNPFAKDRFSAVLVMSGFFDEKIPEALGEETYWRNDNIERGKYE